MKLLKSMVNTLGFVSLLIIGTANATLIDVDFFDENGPQWQGVVDTETDTLTIKSWVEGSGGASFWTPTTELTFTAYQTFDKRYHDIDELMAYDVADDWDGIIGQNWGFLSDLNKKEIDWAQGSFLANSARIGWGMFSYNSGQVDTGGTNRVMTGTPFGSRVNMVLFADEVTISTPVPTPASAILFISALGLLYRQRR